MDPRYCILVVGAGASNPYGFPKATSISQLVREFVYAY